MELLVNYKDFDINKLNLYRDNNIFNFIYNDNYFFLRTCFLTISNVGKSNEKYYLEFLLEDIQNQQTTIFYNKICDINDLIFKKTKNSIIIEQNGIKKLRFFFNQDNNIIKSRIFYKDNYINRDILDKINVGDRASCIIFMDNINFKPYLEIIEMHVKPLHRASKKLNIEKITESKIKYYEIDQELNELKSFLNQ